MSWMIIVLFGFSSFLFFTALLDALILNDRRLKKRMMYYLSNENNPSFDRKKFNFLLQMQLYNQKIRKTIPVGKNTEKLENLLARAGVPFSPEEFILFQWMSLLFFSGLFYLILGKSIFIPLGALAGYGFPKQFLKHKQQKRVSKFNDNLPDMITIIIGSLRAGFSFPQSLKSVVEESDSPIREEIDRVLKEMQYGSSLEDALYQLHERMPSGDLELMIQAILIQKQVGGNLATVLDTIVQTIRDRNTIQRQVMTLTAQGRLSGMVIGLLPIVLAFVLYLINPEYIGSLFKHPVGILFVGLGGFLGVIGFILIRKLTTIEV